MELTDYSYLPPALRRRAEFVQSFRMVYNKQKSLESIAFRLDVSERTLKRLIQRYTIEEYTWFVGFKEHKEKSPEYLLYRSRITTSSMYRNATKTRRKAIIDRLDLLYT